MRLQRYALALCSCMFLFTGCVRIENSFEYKNADEINISEKSCVRESAYEPGNSDIKYKINGEIFESYTKEEIEGISYYVKTNNDSIDEDTFTKKYPFMVLSADSFYASIKDGINNEMSSTDGSGDGKNESEITSEIAENFVRSAIDAYTIKVKLNDKVENTNGHVEGNTVYFTLDLDKPLEEAWYAYTADTTHNKASDAALVKERLSKLNDGSVSDPADSSSAGTKPADSSSAGTSPEYSAADKVKPIIKVAWGNSKKTKVFLFVKDNQKLSKVCINQKTYKVTKDRFVKSGKYKGYYKFSSEKKGKNKVEAFDKEGNVRKVAFNI